MSENRKHMTVIPRSTFSKILSRNEKYTVVDMGPMKAHEVAVQQKLSSPEFRGKETVKCSKIKISNLAQKDKSKGSKELEEIEEVEVLETAFSINIKKVVDELISIKEELLEPITETITFKTIKWYPYENTDTVAGEITKIYLQALTDAIHHETEVFRFLAIAKAIHKNIGCKKTIIVWKKLNIIISMCSQFVELNEVAHDIAFYLRYNPEFISPYLKCFERLKHYIKLGNSGELEVLDTQEEHNLPKLTYHVS